MKILKDLKKRGFRFSNDPDEKEMATLYEELSSSLSKFIKEQCTKENDCRLADFELKERFTDWCVQKGLRQWRVGEVNKYMQEKYNSVRMNYDFYNKSSGTFDTKWIRAWEGLSWKA